TLHLKGEGQGNPIPEPALTVEDPETLRCWPGESRPDAFVTLPRFAAAEADRQIQDHKAGWPTHKPMWETHAMQTRHTLGLGVLGGGAVLEPRPKRLRGEQADGGWDREFHQPEEDPVGQDAGRIGRDGRLRRLACDGTLRHPG
ncbi:MAG: hypothetical protein NT069_29880, partial [Planctomycetota bacterium]|nr:hypothetical protein [Planctomycetota bacterium]